MKKILVLGLLCTLFLTGCGGKKLTCSMSESDEGMKLAGELIFTFDSKGEKIQKGSVNMNIEVDEEYAEYINQMKEEMESEYENLKDFTDLEVKASGNTVKVNIKYNTKNLTEDQIDELYYAGLYAEENYEDTKSEFEAEGYTCK